MGSAARSSNSDGGTPLRFQRPSQALGRRHAQLEGVERLGKTPAVLGHGQPIQQGPLQVRDGHAGFADPHLLFAEEAAGFDLNEPVRRVADGEAAPSLAREFTRLEEAVVHGLQVKDFLTPLPRERLRWPVNEQRLSRAIEGMCCQSAKVGHFETREGYCYEEWRASSLRVLL